MREKLLILLHSNLLCLEFSINALNERIEEQAEQLKILNDKFVDLSSQIHSNTQLRAETDRQR